MKRPDVMKIISDAIDRHVDAMVSVMFEDMAGGTNAAREESIQNFRRGFKMLADSTDAVLEAVAQDFPE